MSNIYALCKFCEVENEFIPLEVRPYSDDFQAGAESRESEIESLRQQLANTRNQEPVAIYNGREGEYGYETISIFSDFKEGTVLFTSAGAMTKRDQACIAACSKIPTYQLTGEDDKPTDLDATIESLRQQLDAAQAQIVALRGERIEAWRRSENQRDQLASRDAEVAELKAEVEEESAIRERLAKLLAETAIALKGEEQALTKHSWHDLGWCAAEVVHERDKLRNQVTLLRDALKYSRHQCEGLRVWGGMSWSYHPFQAKRIFDACEEALAATEPKP